MQPGIGVFVICPASRITITTTKHASVSVWHPQRVSGGARAGLPAKPGAWCITCCTRRLRAPPKSFHGAATTIEPGSVVARNNPRLISDRCDAIASSHRCLVRTLCMCACRPVRPALFTDLVGGSAVWPFGVGLLCVLTLLKYGICCDVIIAVFMNNQ